MQQTHSSSGSRRNALWELSILLTCTLILLTNSIFAGPFPTYPVQWHTNLFQEHTLIHSNIPHGLPSLQMFSLTLNFITTMRGKLTAQPNGQQWPMLTHTQTHIFTHMLVSVFSLLRHRYGLDFFLFHDKHNTLFL